MKLLSFRIFNYRSIIDSNWCELSSDNITGIIGQNESGKTSVLEALKSFHNGIVSHDIIRSDLSNPKVSCCFTIIPGKFERNDNKYIDEVEWTAGNIVELTSDVEDLVVIVKIKEVMQPTPKELNEARGIATADYQEYLEVEWIEQLKAKYPVVINNEVLQQLTTVN